MEIFGTNPPPDKPTDPKWAEQARREKAAERAAKSGTFESDNAKWANLPLGAGGTPDPKPTPLSETDEYKVLHATLMGDPPLRDLQIAGFALLDLIKARGL